MTDLAARLKNWRSVHLARLHILMEEAADYVALLEAGNSLSHSGFMVMSSAVDGMSGEIKRLRMLSGSGDCPAPENAANEDNTPATHATPREGIEQDGCTLTDAERAALQWFGHYGLPEHYAATLVALLERTA